MEQERCLEILCEGKERIAVEGDIIVPDVKADVLKVLQVDASAHITDKGITSGGIFLEGKLNVNILYIPDGEEESTGCIKASFDFRDRFELGEVDDSAKLSISAEVIKIEFTLLNSRKLAIKAVVCAEYEVIGSKDNKINQCQLDDGAECVYENFVEDVIASVDDCEFVIRDSMEIPASKVSAKEILKTDSKITQKEIKAVSGKIIAKGVVNVCVLYLTCEGGVDFCESEFPFTEVFDLYNCEPSDDCSVRLSVFDITASLEPDNESDMRIINVECLVGASTRTHCQRDINIISDCYYIGKDTQLVYNECNVNCFGGRIQQQKSVKEIIVPDSNLPPITRIYNVIAELEGTKIACNQGEVNVETKLKVYILYLTDNKKCAVYSFRKDIPLNFNFNCDTVREGMKVNYSCDVDHVSYNMNSMGEIELRCILDFDIDVVEKKKINVISDVSVSDKTDKNDITICFAKEGDTLWSIAKKYAVKAEDICQLNSLDENSVLKGHKILIPC